MTSFLAGGRLGLLETVSTGVSPSSIARLAGGGFVTVSGGGSAPVVLARYDADGINVGAGITLTTQGQTFDVVGLPTGGFAAVWQDGVVSGQSPFSVNQSIKVQFFTDAGEPVSEPTVVNAPASYVVYKPNIAAFDNGAVAISWTQFVNPGRSTVLSRVVGGDGTPLGNVLIIDSSGQAIDHDITVLSPTTALVAIRISDTTNGWSFLVRSYDPTTGTVAPNDLVRIVGAISGEAEIIRLSDGNFVIAWGETVRSAASGAIHAQVYSPAGVSVGSLITLDSSYQFPIALAPLDNGGFALSYASSYTAFAVQLFTAAGIPTGSAFTAPVPTNSPTTSVTQFGSGDLAVAYGSSGTESISPQGSLGLFYSVTDGTSSGETLAGTASRDVLRGLEGADMLIGLAGDDLLIGGAGADTLNGGDGSDTADYDDSGAGVTVSLANGTALGGTAEGDILISIESLTGSAFDDLLTGDAGANRLDGGNGDDRLVGGAGADILIGGNGIDTADYSASAAGVTVSLLAGVIGIGGDAEGDALFQIERVIGTAYADTLIGNGAANVLRGGDGDDVLIGGANGDTLDGGTGIDTASYETSANAVTVNLAAGSALYGDAQGDTLISIENLRGSAFGDMLTGDGGANRLEGLAGNDTLTGGLGVDTLTGGAGNDVFSDTAAGLNGDTITDFGVGDTILFQGMTIATSGMLTLTGETLRFNGGTLRLAGFTIPTGYRTAEKEIAGSGLAYTLEAIATAPVSTRAAARDFNGDGRSDILWRNDNGQLSNWLGSANGGFVGNDTIALRSVPTSWQVVGSGDFNGDGRADILWRNSNGQFSDWLGQANGGFTANDANALRSVATSWHVTGTGDFNGDGRADIVWRNDAGQVSDWLGQGDGGFAPNDANALRSVPISWQIVGTGDFNGDGRADILWRNGNGQLSDWLGQANGGFVANDASALTSAPTSWRVVGTGDFNGDGRDDILWRNDDGRLSDWLGQANGSFVGNDANALRAAPTSWQVAEVGDYNGDGRADILWRNDSGVMSDWLGQANGGFMTNDAVALSVVGTAWHIAPHNYFV